MFVGSDTANAYVVPISVSGTTLTLGTAATTASAGSTTISGKLSNNRIAVIFDSASYVQGGIVSISGTTASLSTVDLGIFATASKFVQIFGTQAIVVTNNGVTANQINVLTDNSGTAVAGTPAVNPIGGTSNAWTLIGCNASQVFLQVSSTVAYHVVYGISGNNPSLISVMPSVAFLNATGAQSIWAVGSGIYSSYYANFENSSHMRTNSYKHVPLNTQTNFLTYSFDGTGPAVTQQAAGIRASAAPSRSSLTTAAGFSVYASGATGTNQSIFVRRVELA